MISVAALGATFLAVVVVIFWAEPNDNLAYWLAGSRLAQGEPIYVLGDAAFAPYAYHYPPPLAQVLAPLTIFVPTIAYIVAYRALLLLAVWDLAGRTMLAMLALIAFIPVAVELRFENVHLFIAVAIVLGLRRWPFLFAIASVVKLSPGLGIVYLVLRRRWRDAAVACVVGAAIVGASIALDAGLWQAWLDSVLGRAGMVGNSLIPVPYAARAAAGLALTVVAGVLGRRTGELLLVAAITVANPGLSLAGFAVLAAVFPIWFAGPDGIGAVKEPKPADPPATSVG